MKSRKSASKAARSFSEHMIRLRGRGESLTVERGGKAICEILPVGPARFSGAELADLLRSLAKPDEAYLAAVEKVTIKQPTIEKSGWRR